MKLLLVSETSCDAYSGNIHWDNDRQCAHSVMVGSQNMCCNELETSALLSAFKMIIIKAS